MISGRSGASVFAGSDDFSESSSAFSVSAFFELPKPKSSSSSWYEELGSRFEAGGLGETENEGSSIKEMKPEDDDDMGGSSTRMNVVAVGVGALESSVYNEPHHVAAGG